VLEPVSVALKFGFIAVLYLFILWVARSALRDLRPSGRAAVPPPDATGLHAASGPTATGAGDGVPWLVVERAVGIDPGSGFELDADVIIGRGAGVDIRIEDTFASSRHALIAPHGALRVIEDLGSTNGTFLNGEPLRGPQPLHSGDQIRIGETEFSFRS